MPRENVSLVNAALRSLGIDPGTHGPLGGKKIKNVLLERLPETTCLLANQLLNYMKSRAPPWPDFYSGRPPRTDPRKLLGVRPGVRPCVDPRTNPRTDPRTNPRMNPRKETRKLYKSSPTYFLKVR